MKQLDSHAKKLLRDPIKRRAWIKYQIHMLGLSMAKVADNSGVCRQAFYNVFRAPYPRMERVIADTLGYKPQDLFPERYDADGLPSRTMGRPQKSTVNMIKNTTNKGACNVQ